MLCVKQGGDVVVCLNVLCRPGSSEGSCESLGESLPERFGAAFFFFFIPLYRGCTFAGLLQI